MFVEEKVVVGFETFAERDLVRLASVDGICAYALRALIPIRLKIVECSDRCLHRTVIFLGKVRHFVRGNELTFWALSLNLGDSVMASRLSW